jgi:hypothetical protein
MATINILLNLSIASINRIRSSFKIESLTHLLKQCSALIYLADNTKRLNYLLNYVSSSVKLAIVEVKQLLKISKIRFISLNYDFNRLRADTHINC